ncbi:ribosomal protein L28 [Arctopsyche grandis]|uniref:ribosomal protein L28 n=1 Tax=Arctopsyche grandis TaxID=121162 RepID=UPI00406D72F1
MSAHLSWMVIRNNHAFLMKRRNVDKPFSREPHNLTNLNSFRYNGLVHRKTLCVAASRDKKGFGVEWRTRKGRAGHKPAQGSAKRLMKGGPRRALHKLRAFASQPYRRDLRKAALRKASAVLRSQRKIKPRKAKPQAATAAAAAAAAAAAPAATAD